MNYYSFYILRDNFYKNGLFLYKTFTILTVVLILHKFCAAALTQAQTAGPFLSRSGCLKTIFFSNSISMSSGLRRCVSLSSAVSQPLKSKFWPIIFSSSVWIESISSFCRNSSTFFIRSSTESAVTTTASSSISRSRSGPLALSP